LRTVFKSHTLTVAFADCIQITHTDGCSTKRVEDENYLQQVDYVTEMMQSPNGSPKLSFVCFLNSFSNII